MLESINAVTLITGNMKRACEFYRSIGFELRHGGPGAEFSSFRVGDQYLNLVLGVDARPRPFWGRVIFHVADVDALYGRVVASGLAPAAPPRDAEWGERYFHLADPDGHELSFARPLERS